MQHLPITEVQRRLVREIACVSCYQRPPGSEALGPQVARTCEKSCPLFFHLPKLARLANHIGERPGECEAGVKDQICQGCALKESAGDYCADYGARTCPLSRYSAAVVARLERMMPFIPDSVAGEGSED
jgi:hypothetical protein